MTREDRRESWQSPLAGRYASEAMRRNFSDATRHRHWRRLWLELARCEKELGLAITDAQIEALEAHQDDIDYEAADRYERELRHDVMAHVHALGDVAPEVARLEVLAEPALARRAVPGPDGRVRRAELRRHLAEDVLELGPRRDAAERTVSRGVFEQRGVPPKPRRRGSRSDGGGSDGGGSSSSCSGSS